jgi:hypothetical protein
MTAWTQKPDRPGLYWLYDPDPMATNYDDWIWVVDKHKRGWDARFLYGEDWYPIETKFPKCWWKDIVLRRPRFTAKVKGEQA